MVITEKTIRIINGYAVLGERILKNGTRLIGHVPHRGTQAYLHLLFSPAPIENIKELKAKLPSAAQALEHYEILLTEHNGAVFFLGSLALNGIRIGLISRSSEDRQPFDLLDLNSFERPKNADPKTLYIGSYNSDGSLIYLEPNGEVLVCKKNDATPYARWANLSEMISTEIPRLAQFYDQNGQVIDKCTSRLPLPNI
jgi:hypothetical protein